MDFRIFKKNKEAEIQFLLEFGEKKIFSDLKSRVLLTKHTICSREKKNITTRSQKIVDILTKSLEPVEEFMWQNISKILLWKHTM